MRVAGGRNQAEAEFIQGLLLEEGCRACSPDGGFDVPDFLAAGPRDVLVPEAGAETAREVLMQAELGPRGSPRPRGPRPLVLAGVILGGGAAAALVAWLLRDDRGSGRGRLRPLMDFAPSDRVVELLERVRGFMEEHVDPVERDALVALDREVAPGVAYPEILVELRERPRRGGSGTCSSRTSGSGRGSPTGSTGCSAS